MARNENGRARQRWLKAISRQAAAVPGDTVIITVKKRTSRGETKPIVGCALKQALSAMPIDGLVLQKRLPLFDLPNQQVMIAWEKIQGVGVK